MSWAAVAVGATGCGETGGVGGGRRLTAEDILRVAQSVPVSLSISAEAEAGAGICVPLSITSLNAAGAPLAIPADRNLTLTTSGDGVFFSDDDCGTAVTAIPMSEGQSAAQAYFKDSTVGAETLTASLPGLDDAVFAIDIHHNPPVLLAWSGVSEGSVYSCLPFQLTLRDALAQATVFGVETLIVLSSSEGGYFEDESCSSPVSSLALGQDQSVAQVYFRTTQPGPEQLLAQAGSVPQAAHPVAFNAAPAVKLRLQGPMAVNTTQCSVVTLAALDVENAPANVDADTPVALAPGEGGGSFFAVSGCSSPVAGITLAAGTSMRTLYFKQTAVSAPVTLTATAADLDPGNLEISVTNGTATILELVSSGGNTFDSRACIPLTVRTRDASGNVVSVSTATGVSLSSSGGGAFYSNSACTSAVSSASISAGTFSRDFWFKMTKVGVTSLKVSAPVKLPATQAITILPGPAAKLFFASGPTPFAAGTCAPFTVGVRDANNNAAPAPAGLLAALSDSAAGGAFYSDAGCASAISSIPVVEAQILSNVFYYRKDAAGSVVLRASYPGLSAVAKNVAVSTGLPTKIALVSPKAAGIVNGCIGYNLRIQDELSVSVNTPAAVSVTLSGAEDGAFYSNSKCTAPITARNVPAGQGAANLVFYYRKPSTGAVTLTLADAAGALAGTTRPVTVSSGIASQIVYSAGPTSVNVGSCNKLTIQLRDEGAQNVTTPVALPVVLSSTGLAPSFHTASNCSEASAVTQATIPQNKGAVAVYLREGTPGPVILGAAAGELAPASRPVTIVNLATRLAFASGAASLPVLSCGAYVIQATDGNATAVDAPEERVLSLSGLSGSASFFLDPDCSLSLDSVPMLKGTSAVTVYVSGMDAADFTLGAAAAGLSPAAFPIQLR
ncbi:MAG: hypothetical protein IT285_03175 [Bdellovibrionales bacterium]|nr:hypothetical protein [Bdellovibrionales bacterium]